MALTDDAPAMFLKLNDVEGDSKFDGYDDCFVITGFDFLDGVSYNDRSGLKLSFSIKSRKGHNALLMAKDTKVPFKGKTINTDMFDKERKEIMEFEFEDAFVTSLSNYQSPGKQSIDQMCELFVLKVDAEWKTFDEEGDVIDSSELHRDYKKGKSKL